VDERATIPEETVEDEILTTHRNGVLDVHLSLAQPEERADDTQTDIVA
jgi:HSP20 family molecular chaperone IbpA